MARKRYIEETIGRKRTINELSPHAFTLWIRMLAVCDDFGVVPGDSYELRKVTGIDSNLLEDTVIETALRELCESGDDDNRLLRCIIHGHHRYFIFDSTSFDRIQKQLIRHRRGSEYLNIYDVEDGIAKGKLAELLEHAGSYRELQEVTVSSRSRVKPTAKSIKKKVREKSSKKEDFNSSTDLSAPCTNGHKPASGLVVPHSRALRFPSVHGGTKGGEIDWDPTVPPADIPEKIVRILHEIGARTGIPAYENIRLKHWRKDLEARGERIGYACMLRCAERFEQWLVGGVESGQVKRDGRHNPRTRFFSVFCDPMRLREGEATTGDTPTSWPVTTNSYFATPVTELIDGPDLPE